MAPTLEMSRLELWLAAASGTGLRASSWLSFSTLASALAAAPRLRDTDLEQKIKIINDDEIWVDLEWLTD